MRLSALITRRTPSCSLARRASYIKRESERPGRSCRAGVPHLIVPFAHDQPDNAARCRRLGVAEIIDRDDYTAESAAKILKQIFADDRYTNGRRKLSAVVNSEGGTSAACDAIEGVLS